MGKEKKAIDYITIIKKLSHSGLSGSPPPNRRSIDYSDMPSIDERVKWILGCINNTNREASNMLFFVMYDIENNKVRRYIVKYLEKQGCSRVQRSVFLADLDMAIYNEIRKDLAEVQETYENKDSILVVPISTDLLKSMKIIGKNISVDVITHSRNTLFF
jgi:CRISPR-associated protein Cas2